MLNSAPEANPIALQVANLTTTLYLMRHGEVHNPEGILYGRLPGFYLSDAGVQQAHSAGNWLAEKPISAIYASPMERAQQTASIVAGYQDGLKPRVEPRLMEVHTPYQGRPTEELAAGGWDLYTGNEPPFELPMDVLDRVLDFFDHVWENHVGESVLAVAHGDILVFPWLHAKGFVPEALMKDNLMAYELPTPYPATASIMTFNLDGPTRDRLPRVSFHCPH